MTGDFVSSSNCGFKCSGDAEKTLRTIMTRKCCICGEIYQMTAMEYAFQKFGRIVHDFSEHDGCDDDWCCPDCAEKILKIKNL